MTAPGCWQVDALWWPSRISLEAWMLWMTAQERTRGASWRILREDRVGGALISSVFLGFPAPFECMVFGGALDARQWRASWRDDILAIHDSLVMQLRAPEEDVP
jgi:hypothetical protein